MMSDQRNQHRSDQRKDADTVPPSIQPIALQAFAVQIVDIFPVEIVAKRFPIAINNPHIPINAQFNIIEMGVDPENLQAQVMLEVKIVPDGDSHSFEILFKLVAIFTYSSEYTQEKVSQFLQQGSLSLMLPFARELVLSLSTRLHLPPIVLSLVQLAAPPVAENE